MELLILNSFKRKRKMEEEIKSFRNMNINLILVCVCVSGGRGGILPLCWFSFNNSETVKAVDLAFCSIK